MATVAKTIIVTEKNEAWINSRVESGDYGNASEYIRDLIRKDQAIQSQHAKLAALLQEGLNSGFSERSVLDILEDAKASLKANGKV